MNFIPTTFRTPTLLLLPGCALLACAPFACSPGNGAPATGIGGHGAMVGAAGVIGTTDVAGSSGVGAAGITGTTGVAGSSGGASGTTGAGGTAGSPAGVTGGGAGGGDGGAAGAAGDGGTDAGAGATGAVKVYDLKNDWSDTQNPTGPWTIMIGTDVAKSMPNWVGETGQNAYVTKANGIGHIPMLVKVSISNFEGKLAQNGDLVVHAQDEGGGPGLGQARVVRRPPRRGPSTSTLLSGSPERR